VLCSTVLSLAAGKLVLMISMATATYVGGPPASGVDLRIGPYECEVDSEISAEE